MLSSFSRRLGISIKEELIVETMLPLMKFTNFAFIFLSIFIVCPVNVHAGSDSDFYVIGNQCKLVRDSGFPDISTEQVVTHEYGTLILACNSTSQGIKCRPSDFQDERAQYRNHQGVQTETGYLQYAATYDGFSIEITAAVKNISRIRTENGIKVFERVVCDGGYQPVAVIE